MRTQRNGAAVVNGTAEAHVVQTRSYASVTGASCRRSALRAWRAPRASRQKHKTFSSERKPVPVGHRRGEALLF
jgi:hypothetical protein